MVAARQEMQALRIRRSARRHPGAGAPRWPAGCPDELELPRGCCAGDLVQVLEFLQARIPLCGLSILACAVFGSWLHGTSWHALALIWSCSVALVTYRSPVNTSHKCAVMQNATLRCSMLNVRLQSVTGWKGSVMRAAQVFGAAAGMQAADPAFTAAELLQAPRSDGLSALAPDRRSVVGHIHARLLDLARTPYLGCCCPAPHGGQHVRACLAGQHVRACLERLVAGVRGRKRPS